MQPPNLVAPQWQSRPVFISSTFRDMQAERDYLRQFVFPRLEEELRQGRIQLEPIDLRQGVETVDLVSDEAREQLVLKVCLEEIERSRPFFIVLLGDRYGWVPPQDRLAAAAEEFGFSTDLCDKSVTALEIEFGILKRNTDQRQRSFFYFREPLPYLEMPEEVREMFSDQFAPNLAAKARHGRLLALKQFLASDPELAARVHYYHVDWDASRQRVCGLQAWGDMVYRHLLGELQQELRIAAQRAPKTLVEQEREALEEFIDRQRRNFTGRKELIEQLEEIALSPVSSNTDSAITAGVTWGACVTGESGCGKSALFAQLATRLSGVDSIVLLKNAAAATAHGSQTEPMLTRFVADLADAAGIENSLPPNPTAAELDVQFNALLRRVVATRRVVVLLDAIDRFDTLKRADQLPWLRAREWPANARLIATSVAGRAAENLSQWFGIEELEIPPLNVLPNQDDDASAIAGGIWRRYHRQVNSGVVDVLRNKHLPDGSYAAGNPLWLTLAMEHLNLLDSDDFDRADRLFWGTAAERMRALQIDTAEQMPPQVEELYKWLLGQTERVYGQGHVRAFCALILVSRWGLRESDLLALLPRAADLLCPGEPHPPISPLHLAAIRRGFRAHLIRRGDLEQCDFFHPQMRTATEVRLSPSDRFRQELHRLIADHLYALPSSDAFRASELMYHLVASDAADKAALLFSDPSINDQTISASATVLLQCLLMGDESTRPWRIRWVASLLRQPGLSHAQIGLLADRLISLCQGAVNVASLETCKALMTDIQSVLQELSDSAPYDCGVQQNLSITFEALGDFALRQGRHNDAQRLIEETCRIRQAMVSSEPANLEFQYGLSLSTAKLGDLATAQGKSDPAVRIWNEVLETVSHLATASPSDERLRFLSICYERLHNLAVTQGRIAEAQRYGDEALGIRKQLAAAEPANPERRRELASALEQVGHLAQRQGNLDVWKASVEEAFGIRRQLSEAYPDIPSVQSEFAAALTSMGDLASKEGNQDEAELRLEKAVEIRQRLAKFDADNTSNQRALADSLERLGDLYASKADFASAQRCYEDARQIARCLVDREPANADWKGKLADLYGSLGHLALRQTDVPATDRTSAAWLSIRDILLRSGQSEDIAAANTMLSRLDSSRRKLEEASRYFEQSHEILQQLVQSDPTNVGLQRDISWSFADLGDLANAAGDYSQAQQRYREALSYGGKLVSAHPQLSQFQRDLSVFHYKLAMSARQAGDVDCYVRQMQACYGVLQEMKAQQLHFDSQMREIYRQLMVAFGDA